MERHMHLGWLAFGTLALAHLSGDHGWEARPTPTPERMGGLDATTWSPTGNLDGVRVFLTPHGLSASDQARLAHARRSGGIDPYAANLPIAPGRYHAHAVGMARGRPAILGAAEVQVEPHRHHWLNVTPRRDRPGAVHLGWSFVWPATAFGALDGAGTLPPSPATPVRRNAKGNVITPKNGAELVEIVSVQSRVHPVVVAWLSSSCGLCQDLHPTLVRAGRAAQGWTLVAGDAEAMEAELPAQHLVEGSPYYADRYPTLRRFENGRMISEAPDPVVDHWIEKKDAADLDRWARQDVSVADLGPPPRPA